MFDQPFTVDAERAYIAGFPARGIFHVAIDDANGRLVGLQNLEPIATYTRAMDHVASCGTYVDLERRRQGIAARLFDASLAAARDKGYTPPRSRPTCGRGLSSSARPGVMRESTATTSTSC